MINLMSSDIGKPVASGTKPCSWLHWMRRSTRWKHRSVLYLVLKELN